MPAITPLLLYYPKSAVMWHRYATVVVGNPISISHVTSQDFTHTIHQAVADNGDKFRHSCYLGGGGYTLNVLGFTMNSGGKLDWYIDNVLAVSGQDWYSGAPTSNVIKTAGVTVVGSGPHTIMGVVNGKNVLSISYDIYLTAIALV